MLSTKSVYDPAIKACVGGSAAEVERVWSMAGSVVASSNALTSNKGCSDKLMSYTNKGEQGRSVLLPKPASDLVISLHVGIRGTCIE